MELASVMDSHPTRAESSPLRYAIALVRVDLDREELVFQKEQDEARNEQDKDKQKRKEERKAANRLEPVTFNLIWEAFRKQKDTHLWHCHSWFTKRFLPHCLSNLLESLAEWILRVSAPFAPRTLNEDSFFTP